jgi:hypothetical protein
MAGRIEPGPTPCEYQESKRWTWCSSSPVAFLLVWNVVSMHQRVPVTRTTVGSATGVGDQQR